MGLKEVRTAVAVIAIVGLIYAVQHFAPPANLTDGQGAGVLLFSVLFFVVGIFVVALAADPPGEGATAALLLGILVVAASAGVVQHLVGSVHWMLGLVPACAAVGLMMTRHADPGSDTPELAADKEAGTEE